MKSGYSLLLGEYINVDHLDYKDCKSFQVVCPSCYEPIFKVSRELSARQVSYLSHYPESTAVPEDCELRVRGISSEDQMDHNSTARNQKLDYFLSVLREMVGTHEMYPNGSQKAQTKLRLSKSLGMFRDVVYEHQKKNPFPKPNFYSMCDEYAEDITEMGGVIKTTFSFSIQKRIAYDLWVHLMSAKGRKNLIICLTMPFLSSYQG